MNYLPYVPTQGPLSGVVEVMFCLDDYEPSHQEERIVPNGRTQLIIALDERDRYVRFPQGDNVEQVCCGAWVSGVQSAHMVIGNTANKSSLAVVQFVPGFARTVLHQSMGRFNDSVIHATEVFGDSILALRERLQSVENPDKRLVLFEQWLVDQHDAEFNPPQIILDAIALLTQDPTNVALTEFVAGRGDVSYKHFVNLFKAYVGPAPKVFQRILRLAAVFPRLQAEAAVDWAELSLELGYSDQSHFIREFHKFAGYRPRKFLSAGHERLNFFPEE